MGLQQKIATQSRQALCSTRMGDNNGQQHMQPRKIVFTTSRSRPSIAIDAEKATAANNLVREPELSPCTSLTLSPLPWVPTTPNLKSSQQQQQRPSYCLGSCHY